MYITMVNCQVLREPLRRWLGEQDCTPPQFQTQVCCPKCLQSIFSKDDLALWTSDWVEIPAKQTKCENPVLGKNWKENHDKQILQLFILWCTMGRRSRRENSTVNCGWLLDFHSFCWLPWASNLMMLSLCCCSFFNLEASPNANSGLPWTPLGTPDPTPTTSTDVPSQFLLDIPSTRWAMFCCFSLHSFPLACYILNKLIQSWKYGDHCYFPGLSRTWRGGQQSPQDAISMWKSWLP